MSLKIAICIPCHGDTKARFTQCLASMIAFTCGARIEVRGEPVDVEIETFLVSCSLLPESRNRLVAEAILWDADYLLWLDADHVFPRDTLVSLLSRSKLVVGCNYARRFNPTSPTASRFATRSFHEPSDASSPPPSDREEMELVWTTAERVNANDVEEVAHLGLGLCLIDMRVFTMLERRAAAGGKPHFWPLFRMDPTDDGIRFVGEDVHFFKMLREAGVPIHLDHALSWDVGHISDQLLTNALTVVQRPAFEAWKKRRLEKFEEAVR